MKNISLCLLIAALVCCANATAYGNKEPPAYIEGCAEYDASQLCAVCQYGYSKLNGACIPNTQNGECCAAYDIYGSCSKCAPGLYFNDPYCLRNSIYGCIDKKDNTCLACGKGLTLSNGVCFTNIPNCDNYTSSGQCNSCSYGYTLINSYCVEVPQIENCKTQTFSGCAQCLEGFYLTSDRKCNRNEFGCLKYWKQQCLACLPPFQLINGGCAIEGCVSFDGRGCRECKAGLTLTNGICLWNNCLKFSNGICLQCAQNYRLTSEGCLKIVAFQCQQCRSGYVFVNNKCTKIIPGCNRYNQNGLCLECRVTFVLTVNGACQIIGCAAYGDNGCTRCVSPFELVSGVCLIKFCLKYSAQGCTQCQQNYVLSNSRCVIQDNSCIKYNNQGVCIQCVKTHRLADGLCVKGDRGCIYNPQGQCQCRANFYLNQQGKCYLIGCSNYDTNDNCLACYQPFTYNSNNRQCQIYQCLDYISTGCKQCSSGYIIADQRCVIEVSYCSSYNSQGSCSACSSGFKLSYNQCIKQIVNCLQLNPDRISCKRCANNFVLFKGQCKAPIPNCKILSSNQYRCSVCQQNYFLRDYACYPADPYCAKYQKKNQNDVCVACTAGYFLSNDGSCQRSAAGCIYQGSKITSCRRPFLYDIDSSSCYIPGCLKFNQNGCVTCSSPFELADGNCVIKFCQQYDTSSCLKCSSGYKLDNRFCVPTDENCLEFNSNGCIRCRAGFNVQSGRCVISDFNCLNYGENGVCVKCKDTHFLNRQRKCVVKQFGCIYENNNCRRCTAPFVFNGAKNTCQIQNCAEINQQGCLRCATPFVLSGNRDCVILNCLNVQYSRCVQCAVGYHIKDNLFCQKDDLNCLSYNNDGDCQLCTKGLTLNSYGECTKLDSVCLKISEQDKSRCLECASGYFLNHFYQCQKISKGCIEYTNGVCSKCAHRFFLYKQICFPYTKGCVRYNGKDCTQCKVSYVLKNGECFGWKHKDLSLIGNDDQYDFLITPIDVRQSKYYINNLSPASQIGKVYFSSVFDLSYQDPSLTGVNDVYGKGWKAKVADNNQFIGILINEEPVTFFAIQLEAVQGNYIQEFEIEYSVNGVDFISVQNSFTVDRSIVNNIVTIYFTGLYAKSIRIRVVKFNGWPAARIEFFYYDVIRFRKISNLKSLKYLQETISSNYVDRVDNQIYINQVYFFNPVAACTSNELCFTGLQLCQKKKINELVLNFKEGGSVSELYLTYTIDGRSYNCMNKCAKISVPKGTTFKYDLKGFQAQGIRIYPTKYEGTPKFNPTFFYQ